MSTSSPFPFEHLGAMAVSALVAALVAAFVTGLLLDALYSTGFRRLWQRRLLRKWFSTNVARTPEPSSGRRVSETVDLALQSLTQLATAGNERALYGLPYRQLCGQIASVLRVDSQLPIERLEQLFLGFAPILNPQFTISVLEGRAPAPSLSRYRESSFVPPNVTNDTDAARLADGQQLLLYHAERGLDDLQTYLSAGWERIDYIGAVVVAGWLVFLLGSTVPSLPSDFRSGFRSVVFQGFLVLTLLAALLVPLMRRAIAKIASVLA